jgi:drug/metabolite transporter (DMT)-like permease
MPRPREGVLVAAFAAIAVLVGGNAVGIRFSNRELDPLWGAGLRFALAAIVLVVAMAVLRLKLPRGRALTGALLFGVLDVGGAFALGYYALVELHAGFGSILLALVPLATLLLAVLQNQEGLRVVAVAGTFVALLGVALMSRAPLRESLPLLSFLAAVGSALCIAQATVVVRRFPPVHPVTMNAIAMTAGAAVLIAGSLLAGESLAVPQRSATWVALGYLVVVGSVVVFVLFLFVLRHWAASRTAYVYVLVPFVTVALSAWLDNEPVGAGLVLGGLLVLTGVYVGALRPARTPPMLAERAVGPALHSPSIGPGGLRLGPHDRDAHPAQRDAPSSESPL